MNVQQFRRILLAVDDSPQSQNAVEVVADFASRGTEVRVVHVWNLKVRDIEGFWDVETRSQAESLVGGFATRLGRAGLKASTEIRTATGGHVYREIVAAAEDYAAELIALGSRGRSDLGGLFLGSVSHDVIAHTDRSVLVVRAAPRSQKPFRRILLAIAGGDEIPAAVSTTISISRQWGADVVVFHVSRILAVEGSVWVEPAADVQGCVDAVVRQLRAAGVPVQAEVTNGAGSIASEIAAAAEGWDADLVVMGSRRLGELRGLLTGATDHALVHRIQTPVLIAERSQEV